MDTEHTDTVILFWSYPDSDHDSTLWSLCISFINRIILCTFCICTKCDLKNSTFEIKGFGIFYVIHLNYRLIYDVFFFNSNELPYHYLRSVLFGVYSMTFFHLSRFSQNPVVFCGIVCTLTSRLSIPPLRLYS